MKRIQHLAILFAAVAVLPAFAGIVDDAIALAEKGVSDDVITAWAEGKGGEPVGVNDILRMKDAKVPDRVIAMIIRQQNRAPAVAAHAPVAQVEEYHNEAPPVERQAVHYADRASTGYATPATYAPATCAPVTYAAPAYYSDYYYSSPYYYGYPYYSSYYYPYGYLSLSFGSHCYGGHYYGGSHYGGHYGSGYYGSGHYGSYHGSGYYGGTGYRSSTGYSSGSHYSGSHGTGFSSSFRR